MGKVFQTFYWTPPAGLDNPNSKTPIAKPTAATEYVFNGIDQFGCIVKDTVRVIVLDPSLNLFRKMIQSNVAMIPLY